MKLSKIRRQIAWESARLIHQHAELRYSDAKRLAVGRLCPVGVHPRDVPSDEEISDQLRALAKAEAGSHWERRFESYADLLRPLASVRQDPVRHPEGDVLYHSLQVFAIACDRLPYDEELLTAALLHDVGKAIDRRNHVAAGQVALEGVVTPRTAWLIENLPLAQAMAEGTLGTRARRRLRSSPDFDELSLLAECDRAGRRRGVAVPDLEDALDHLRELSRSHDEHDG